MATKTERRIERSEARLQERRQTRDRVQPVLDLIEHVFNQLETPNGKRAFLSAVKSKIGILLPAVLSVEEARRRGIAQ